MRTTEVISITLPPEMAKEARRLAREENRTLSELFRETLRTYQRERRWDEVNRYGRARAERLGIREEDIVPLVKQFRRERRQRRQARA
jgi:CopG family transcriptional regulator / antitoxin EndoAI